ncbi:amidase family protein [Bradyrhizobium sp. ISRA443]|uniref:amidase family protein n=1 Tax=unclassified Bradyrhizobium TaxID=2631580 RepID=UPI002479F084|nr:MULTISPECIES: amidase family protein [unclassified Bradyrhizobium]WGR97489.1 amidase family protein [Bradyrhizobium sp. ISRA436]WGS04379.1 amidase family protein [Bradyrhizobium sp. ISRA437]WGS11261.1 amidase family protein [Bradyrhizobium sp. ISRA443]
MSATQLVNAYGKGDLSPVDAVCAVLDRIKLLDGQLNAFCAVDEEGAVEAALASEKRWHKRMSLSPLDGIPVSVKDLVTAKGMPTRYGSRAIRPGSTSDVDAPPVKLLRQAGAIIFGKTTTSEFGNKIVTENPLTGITRNPWNPARSSGGSSGGSAVAIATGMGPLALATDGGGSIRIPSAWCGVFGFKPSFKRVPSGGGDLFGLSNIGPIGRTVGDVARMMTALTKPCSSDWELVPPDGRDYETGLDDGLKDLRIAVSMDLGIVSVRDDIVSQVRDAVKLFDSLGARVETIDVPPLRSYLQEQIHSIQWMVRLAQLVRDLPDDQQELLDPDTLALARLGEGVPTAVLMNALALRHQLAWQMHSFFDSYDLLVTPTFHVAPPDVPGLPAELQTAPPMTSWCNQTMQPAASIPCGFTTDGLPVGLQIIGGRFSDALVLRAARAFEMARGQFPVPAITELSSGDRA